MNIETVNKIKRITLIALASDDELVETLVLKGGNAIDLAYRPNNDILSRVSYDLDYSLDEGDFNEDQIDISNRIQTTLENTFTENGYKVIDYKFLQKPKSIKEDLADFWGGYKVEFKVIEIEVYQKFNGNIDQVRRNSIAVNRKNSPVFEVEFSKFEYVGAKKAINIDGYKLYVYTPEMIVFEKVRAICQQLKNYKLIIPSFIGRARARDFYDIHLIMEMHDIKPSTLENIELIKNVFAAKKVPTNFIKEIRNGKALHAENWQDVKDTLSIHEEVLEFDYYFDFVLNKFEDLTFP